MKIIYVFSSNEKEVLKNAGFTLLKEDNRNSIYVFGMNKTQNFALADVRYIESDTLTF